MVGLDVTMQVLIEKQQYAELATIDTPLGRLVHDWLLFYEKLHRNSMGVGGAMHDPLALALAIDPTLVRTRPAHIGVDLCGTYAFGATVADYWGERREKDNAKIAVRGRCGPLLQADVRSAARSDRGIMVTPRNSAFSGRLAPMPRSTITF